MIIEIKDGTFKVLTEVTGTSVVEKKDAEGNVIDKFTFAIGDESINTNMFAGQLINGKISYVAKVNTDDEKLVESLKKMYGKALVRAKKYEADAVSICAARKAAEEAEAAAIDELFA